MRAGRLDRRVALQRRTLTYSAAGDPIETWSDLAADRSASVAPLSGDERFSGEQFVAREQVEFRVRWSAAIADLSPQDRVVYPASDAGDSPVPTRSLYDIITVHEIGRHEGLAIRAARQADVR